MLQDSRIDTKVKLAALWASVMFCYIYADYFGLFQAGRLAVMNKGMIPPLGPATDGTMLFVSGMMVIPSLMIFLSVGLPARINRWANLVTGLGYSAIIGLTMWGGPLFFRFYGVIEICLTLLVCYFAWTWPRSADSAR